MADISQWSTKEPENVKLDDLTLSGESGLYVNKVMCAVKKKFNSADTALSQNTQAIGSWTDTTRTDTLKDAVEQLESDVASIVTDSQTVDMETIINTDDVLSVNPGLLNWQKTERAGAVSCYPVPGVMMYPVVDFAFTETGPAEGEKSPTNPSTISGVSTITVTRCETVGVDSTDYTIDLGDTYYGGTLDVASGVMTVTFGGRVFDGTEAWSFVDSGPYYCYRIEFSPPAPSDSALAPVYNTECCTHFGVQNSVSLDSMHFIAYGGRIEIYTTQTTLSDFKSWLASEYAAGHPVSVVYPLATSFTVQLTPAQIYSLSQTDPYTPRINSVYSDQTSVQVGYAKSPIRSEYELTQAIIATEGGV